jgi:hypothetical protein
MPEWVCQSVNAPQSVHAAQRVNTAQSVCAIIVCVCQSANANVSMQIRAYSPQCISDCKCQHPLTYKSGTGGEEEEGGLMPVNARSFLNPKHFP